MLKVIQSTRGNKKYKARKGMASTSLLSILLKGFSPSIKELLLRKNRKVLWIGGLDIKIKFRIRKTDLKTS